MFQRFHRSDAWNQQPYPSEDQESRMSSASNTHFNACCVCVFFSSDLDVLWLSPPGSEWWWQTGGVSVLCEMNKELTLTRGWLKSLWYLGVGGTLWLFQTCCYKQELLRHSLITFLRLGCVCKVPALSTGHIRSKVAVGSRHFRAVTWQVWGMCLCCLCVRRDCSHWAHLCFSSLTAAIKWSNRAVWASQSSCCQQT